MTGIDPRGPRFTAAVTALIVAAALVIPSANLSALLMFIQGAFFAVGAYAGVQYTPTAVLFRRVIRPRLSPPTELEDPRPPQFAQGIGLVFAVVSVTGYAIGPVLLGQVAAGLAFAAALLNAVFGFCLGCELYLRGLRLKERLA